jgi:hypothetical protein
MRAAVLLSLLVLSFSARAEPATERYASAQLRVAQEFLDRARTAVARGDHALAGRLAWQASLDARIAWSMTESEWLRAEAAQLAGAARMLVTRVAASRQ